MLVEKASAFEKTSYRGLFHFISYIRNLRKYDTDFGEASTVGEQDDTVRIMSIHKSKGLEFPVVFLSGLGKAFNKQDVRGKILLDSDLGIGMDCVDLELRTRVSTIKKNVLKRKMDLDAMGRRAEDPVCGHEPAKEKLVMTAADKSLEKKLEKWKNVPQRGARTSPSRFSPPPGPCLDWILMSLSAGGDAIQVRQIPAGELLGQEMAKQVIRAPQRKSCSALTRRGCTIQTTGRRIQRRFSFQYPHQADVGLHAKIAIADLKQQGQLTDEAESQFIPTRPSFLSRDGEERRRRLPGEPPTTGRWNCWILKRQIP